MPLFSDHVPAGRPGPGARADADVEQPPPAAVDADLEEAAPAAAEAHLEEDAAAEDAEVGDDEDEMATAAVGEPVLVERPPVGSVPVGTFTADAGRPTNSSARTRARKAALDILFESEMRRLPTGATLGDRITAAAGTDPTFRPVRAYTATLVEGVRDQRERIDELISTYARDWSLERMPGVDRAILRIGVWELLHNRSVPPAAVISEAVGLASSLSTDASAGFVNGLLARIADLVTDV